MRDRFRFPISYLWAATVLVGIFVFVNTHPIRPHDFWFHLAAGREHIRSGNILGVDIFSFTAAGVPYGSYKMYWLMESIFYGVYQLGREPSIILLHSLLITAAYGIVLFAGARATGNLRAAAFSVIFAAALGISDWNVRPQAIAFLIGALYLLAILELRQTRQKWWFVTFPVGMVLWVNSHGSYIIGIVLLGAWLVSAAGDFWRTKDHQQLKLAALTLLLTCLACLINPRGFSALIYISDMTANPVIQQLVPEWSAPSFDTFEGIMFLGGLLFSAAVLAISPKHPDLFQVITFLGFAALGLKSLRGSVWFGIVIAPTLAFHFSAMMDHWFPQINQETKQSGSPILNALMVAILLVFSLFSLPWLKPLLPLPTAKAGLISAETPVDATQALLEQQWPGQLFHSMSFGSYLSWAAHPEYPVFIDSRIELYALDTWRDYLNISALQPGWDEKLHEYNVQTLMLSPVENTALIKAVSESPSWELVYTSDAALIFSRLSP